MSKTTSEAIVTVKGTVAGFLGLMAAIMALAVALKFDLIDAAVFRRTVGLVIGAAAVLVGNVLPKVRPLSLLTGSVKRSSAAERFAGWVLVLAGAVYVSAFLFLPIAEARRVSSFAGIVSLLLIAGSWTWLAVSGAQAPKPGAATKSRKLMFSLLLAFFYVFATACIGVFFGLAWWMVVVFWFAYAALTALVESRSITAAGGSTCSRV
ncbi:MAG TPA: hypothetical protein VGJ81_02645 [Thermoanaerobaculia bacterium]